MYTKTFALLTVLTLWWSAAWGQGATSTPILAGPLAKLDIKDAKVEASKDAPAYMALVSQGRKSFPCNRTVVQRIDPRPGGAKALIRLYTVCGGPSSFVCEPQIEALWAKHEASIDVAERDRLIKEIQRVIVEGYYIVPLYLNPFVHAVTQKVLPEGEAVHHYWDTFHAPFLWPWEVWEVKG